MRAKNKYTQPAPSRTSEEPVYVDEIYPDDLTPDDPWARQLPVQPKSATSEPPLSFDDPEESDEDEDEKAQKLEAIQPVLDPVKPLTPPPAPKAAPPPRSYRIKMPPPVERRPTPPVRPAPQKTLPAELPRPIRRERSPIPAQPRREERTGTWPVASDPKRAQTTPPKNGHSTYPHPTERTSSRETPPRETPPRESQPPTRATAPPPWHPPTKPTPPPLLVVPPDPAPTAPPTPRETPTQEYSETRNTPTMFPVAPTATYSPTRLAPVEDEPAPRPNQFRPLIDEPLTETETEPTWDSLDTSRPPTGLHDLIERLALPKNALILGVCDDGLPLVLELSDPSPGALLFLGDEVDGLQKHLQSVLASVCLMSDPKQVQVDIITPTPKLFAAQKMFPHVQKVHLPDQDEMFDLLGSLFDLIEQRQRKDNSLAGRFLKEFLPSNKGPVRILMIDQVDVLVEQLAPESLAYLRWLLRRGPAANVWVLASLNTRNAQNVDGKTLKAFGMRITGKIQNLRQANRWTDVPAEKLSALISGEQACMKLDEEIVEFSILA